MRKKKVIALLVAISIIIIIIIFIGILISFSLQEYQRTDEEYISVLIDNKDDFEYVAVTMKQWSEGSIDFKDGISSKNQEIENEILNNRDFYKSLSNLYNLNEISYILIEGDSIAFYFSKFPTNYHGGVFYGEHQKENFCTHSIDEHWVLKMIPNT